MSGLLPVVSQLSRDQLPKIERELLTGLRVARDPAQPIDALKTSLTQVTTYQSAVIAALERAIQDLVPWESYHRLAADIGQLRKDQIELASQTRQLRRESLALVRPDGVSIAHEDQSASPKELITFQTGNEDLAWLNDEVGIGLGTGANGRLSLEIFIARS